MRYQTFTSKSGGADGSEGSQPDQAGEGHAFLANAQGEDIVAGRRSFILYGAPTVSRSSFVQTSDLCNLYSDLECR